MIDGGFLKIWFIYQRIYMAHLLDLIDEPGNLNETILLHLNTRKLKCKFYCKYICSISGWPSSGR